MHSSDEGEPSGRALGPLARASLGRGSRRGALRPGASVVEHARPKCTCGHAWEAHEHYRRGTDCALCPDGGCGRYSARP